MAFRVTKQAITLHYREDKPTAYKLQLVREQVVKYKQLCKNIAATTGIRKGEVEDVLDALCQYMAQMMELGHPVQLGVMGFLQTDVADEVCQVDGRAFGGQCGTPTHSVHPGRNLPQLACRYGD